MFAATAVVAQLITGFLLPQAVGWPLGEGWGVPSLALYVATGAFWLPPYGCGSACANSALNPLADAGAPDDRAVWVMASPHENLAAQRESGSTACRRGW